MISHYSSRIRLWFAVQFHPILCFDFKELKDYHIVSDLRKFFFAKHIKGTNDFSSTTRHNHHAESKTDNDFILNLTKSKNLHKDDVRRGLAK